jgi:hypothetical protein
LRRDHGGFSAWKKAIPPCAIIFDLRGNGGGHYTNMWRFTYELPELTTGRIFALTDAMPA